MPLIKPPRISPRCISNALPTRLVQSALPPRRLVHATSALQAAVEPQAASSSEPSTTAPARRRAGRPKTREIKAPPSPKPPKPVKAAPKPARAAHGRTINSLDPSHLQEPHNALLRSVEKVQATVQSQWGASSLAPLPPLDEWPQLFHFNLPTKPFVLLKDQPTARLVAANFLRDGNGSGELGKDCTMTEVLTNKYEKEGQTEGKTIIEGYAGVGTVTRALLEHPPHIVKRVIAVENSKMFLKHLRPLQEQDSRLTVVEEDPFRWQTYEDIMQSDLMSDVKVQPWEDAPPQLQFICRLPLSVYGDQLISQILRLVPSRSWLFRYGRVPMSFLVPYGTWDRLSAMPDSENRCKLSVVSESVAFSRLSLPPILLQPYHKHFHPPPSAEDVRRAENAHTMADITASNKGKHIGHPYVAATFQPRRDQIITPAAAEEWDYVTRSLFIRNSKPLKEVIVNLGAGAKSLLDRLPERLHLKAPRSLTPEDFALIVDEFRDWPFAPSVYITSASELENTSSVGEGRK